MGGEMSYKMFFAITILFPIYFPLFFLHARIDDTIDNYKYKRRLNKFRKDKEVQKFIQFLTDGYNFSYGESYPICYNVDLYPSIHFFNKCEDHTYNGEFFITCLNTYCYHEFKKDIYIQANSIDDLILKIKNTSELFKNERREEKLSNLGI